MTPEPKRVICYFACDPWQRWIDQMVAENERDRLRYEHDLDMAAWEEHMGLHETETDIETVPVELLVEVQR